MGEIFKVPQRTGQIGRPPHVEIRGAQRQDKEPKILGAAVPGEPTIVDKNSPGVRQPGVEIVDGQPVVTVKLGDENGK